MEGVRLAFAPGVHVELVDREAGPRRVRELGERGTRLPAVVYGPEGCGKPHSYSKLPICSAPWATALSVLAPSKLRLGMRLVLPRTCARPQGGCSGLTQWTEEASGGHVPYRYMGST